MSISILFFANTTVSACSGIATKVGNCNRNSCKDREKQVGVKKKSGCGSTVQ
jgi:hypothetical protein